MIAFGPVPSRRLGRSLGVNHVSPKRCSYDCLYCQVGATPRRTLQRRTFHPPSAVVAEVERRVGRLHESGQDLDAITFVPEGEPTLDANLGAMIARLRPLGIPVAVITNGSLLWRGDVREALGRADVVSVKIDATREREWRRLNRPNRRLGLGLVLRGIWEFAQEYRGALLTETMLVRGLNDRPDVVEGIASFIERLHPSRAYLAVPTRAPARTGIDPPDRETLARCLAILARRLPRVALLSGQAAGTFGHAGDPAGDLLGILAVHPMQEAEARRYLQDAGGGPDALEALIAAGRVVRRSHRGEAFVARAWRRRARCASKSEGGSSVAARLSEGSTSFD